MDRPGSTTRCRADRRWVPLRSAWWEEPSPSCLPVWLVDQSGKGGARGSRSELLRAAGGTGRRDGEMAIGTQQLLAVL